MSGPSKKSWRFWTPRRFRTWLRKRGLRRNLDYLRREYEPKFDAATGYDKQALLAEWSFEASWSESELAAIESERLQGQAARWNIPCPALVQHHNTGVWHIEDSARMQLKREIRDARREGIRWWIQVVVVPLIALVSSITALVSLLL